MKRTTYLLTAAVLALLAVMMLCFVGCDANGTTADVTTVITTDGATSGEITTVITTEAVTTEAVTTVADTTAAETTAAEPDSWVSALFGGGPFCTSIVSSAPRLKKSGFNTIIIWSVHVNQDDTLYLNDVKVCENGEYVGKEAWVEAWHSLKEGETSVQRVELSVGAWGCLDFERIKSYIEKDGTGEDTVLYRNFKALIDATGADAINYDDESCYDSASSIKFGKMCVNMGVKVALCPYTNLAYWKAVLNGLGEDVDRIYVQCYAGGAGNDPDTWAKNLGRKVIPGYWCVHSGNDIQKTAAEVGDILAGAKRVTGGFIWYYDDLRSQRVPNSTADYANAINDAKK